MPKVTISEHDLFSLRLRDESLTVGMFGEDYLEECDVEVS